MLIEKGFSLSLQAQKRIAPVQHGAQNLIAIHDQGRSPILYSAVEQTSKRT
jgi:hypothetical protein